MGFKRQTLLKNMRKNKDISFDFVDMVSVITLKELEDLKEEVVKYVRKKDLIIDIEGFFQEFSVEAIDNIPMDREGFDLLRRITWCDPNKIDTDGQLYKFTQAFLDYYTCKDYTDRKEWQVEFEDLFNSDDKFKVLMLSIGKRVAQCALESVECVKDFINDLMRF